MVEYVPKEEVPSNPTERQQQRQQQQQQHQQHQHQQHQQLQPHQHQPQHGQQHPHQPHQPYHPQSTGPSEQSGGTSQSPTEYQQPRNIQFVRQFLYQMNPNYSATLKFVKDLDVMTRDWTTSEVRFNRRLVKFNFTTENHIQVINFEPITPSEYDNMKPTISCIYWREMGTHVVTSVDIILLLEYFVNQTFDVEEKNRIRRNLQSLKPNTISRANLKDRNFFNLIMSMENPRPRNIEKDLKVFNWSDLGKAISKVMSKYYVVPGDRAHNTNVMNNSNQQWGSIPLTQQQVVRSPQVLPSPIIGSTPPSTTSFQYTPIQQQFPGIPSPGYYSRHPSLPNVTSSQLSTSPNTGGFPTQDPYMHFDKLHTYDQLAQPPPPPPPLQQHQQHQPPIEFTQQQCSSIYQPVVSYANHFNSSPALRTPSMPHVFPTNFQQPQQPQQPQQKYLQQPISVQSEPERISPAISHMNPPSNKNRFQPATGFVSGPIGSSDHSRSSSLIQSVLNAPFNPATSSSGSSSEPLKLASNSDTSASDINDPPSIASWNDNTRQTTPGIRVANKRLNLQDLITREENEHKIESNDDYNEKERDGDKDKGVDNISRLPSIAHLLNNDDMHLPSIKKHKNSNT